MSFHTIVRYTNSARYLSYLQKGSNIIIHVIECWSHLVDLNNLLTYKNNNLVPRPPTCSFAITYELCRTISGLRSGKAKRGFVVIMRMRRDFTRRRRVYIMRARAMNEANCGAHTRLWGCGFFRTCKSIFS